MCCCITCTQQCITVVVICPPTHVKAEYSLTWEKAPDSSSAPSIHSWGEGDQLPPRSECLSQEISTSQSTHSKGGGAVWQAPSYLNKKSLKRTWNMHNSTPILFFFLLSYIGQLSFKYLEKISILEIGWFLIWPSHWKYIGWYGRWGKCKCLKQMAGGVRALISGSHLEAQMIWGAICSHQFQLPLPFFLFRLHTNIDLDYIHDLSSLLCLSFNIDWQRRLFVRRLFTAHWTWQTGDRVIGHNLGKCKSRRDFGKSTMIGAGSDVALGKSKLRTLDEGLVGLGATK